MSADTERWQKVGDIFERLVEVPLQERETLLVSLCGEDQELRKIVVSMLDSQESARLSDESLSASRSDAADAADRAAAAEAARAEAALIDSRVGPWRLVRKIGSGGMGIVWLAERADGQFKQRAALKLIKRGMDSDAVLARFLRERQILARLEHPHIAHLLDGGITDDGRPYFAMEYVEGLPLLDYCRSRNIKLEERIKLFVEVCAAVQFAHERHVVHRDIKPSNVLITANGTAKLLDFGIAKLLQNDDEPVATLTNVQRDRPMTPAYAAPEQISGDPITEATDVYALGGVLYELLTDCRAHDFSGAADASDVLRIIQATDPVAPSRLKLAATPVPRKRLRGDLDVIVLTALRHQPARRYASAAALAGDLHNYLAGHPIAARRDHVVYRAYKFLRRHRIGVAAIVAVAVIAAVAAEMVSLERQARGFAGSNAALAIVDFNNLAQNKDQAWVAPALAQMLSTELALGSRMHALPDELVRGARADLAAPAAGGYAPQTLATLRKRLGADYVLSGSYLISGAGDDAKLRLDLAMQDARSGAAIANVEQNGALADLPALVDRTGADLRTRLGFAAISTAEKKEVDRTQPANTDVARHMGIALDALRKSDPARAKGELLDALALAPGYAPAYVYLAQAWKALGYDAKALAAAEQAAANSSGLSQELRLRIDRQVAVQKSEWSKATGLDKQLVALDPGDPETHLHLYEDLINAGESAQASAVFAELRKLPGLDGDPRVELKAAEAARDQGDPKAQAQHAESALQQAQSRDQLELAAEAKRELSLARDALGSHDEAEKLMREAIADFQRSENPKAEANARTSLANLMTGNKRPHEANDEYQLALKIYQRIGDQAGIAAIYSNLSLLLWDQGDRDAAETAAHHALDIYKETGDLSGEGWGLAALAYMQSDEAASAEVMENYRQAIALDERAGARAHRLYVLNNYEEALRLRGELDAAQEICVKAQAEAKELTDPAIEIEVDIKCASVARDRGEIPDAVAAFERVRNLAKNTGNSDAIAFTDMALAQIDIGYRRFARARERLMRAIGNYADNGKIAQEAEAQSLIALCYLALNQPVERDRAAARARELRRAITQRQEVAVTDIALMQLLGESGEPAQAISQLREFAADAQKRNWLAHSLEAELAALQLLEQAHDPTAPAARLQLEARARQHGFGWVLARLSMDTKQQSEER
ncbi:MAG: protein kinase domain-containing protein [Rudaea sp.]